jgi:hypothetical protein
MLGLVWLALLATRGQGYPPLVGRKNISMMKGESTFA